MPIPAGSFMMGSPASEAGRDADETQHRETVSAFSAGKYEVTVAQYLACVSAGECQEPEWRERGSKYNITTGSDDRYKKLGNALTASSNPIVGVSWNNAQDYVQWLSSKTGKRYRLLAEAEWEYAARAGTPTAYSTGASIGSSQANFSGGPGRTTPVGQYPANDFGLHDMHGNVWEWVSDCYDTACSNRVYRGGSWNGASQYLRSANRNGDGPSGRDYYLGFRLARTGF